MSLEIRVRRFENGQQRDELIEHADSGDTVYGYNLGQDNSFRVMKVDKSGERRKVSTLRVYSAAGYLEVAGTQIDNLGYSPEELRGIGFACDMGD